MRIGFASRAIRINRIGIDALHSGFATLFGCRTVANQSCFAGNGHAVARTVGQLSVGAAALFVFAARDAFGTFRSAVFANIAGGAVAIIHASVRSATRTVRETAARTRIVARIVVRAGDAFAGVRFIERIPFAAGFLGFAITAARTVGNGVAWAAAFVAAGVVFHAAFARTVVADILSGGTADPCGANAFTRSVNHFFAVAVAFRTDGAGFAFAVDTLLARAARRFRAFAGGSMVFGFATWRFTRTRRRRANGLALPFYAFLRCQTLRIRRTSGKIHLFRSFVLSGRVGCFPVSQLYAFRNQERCGVVKNYRGGVCFSQRYGWRRIYQYG